jgi:hypothetical protein
VWIGRELRVDEFRLVDGFYVIDVALGVEQMEALQRVADRMSCSPSEAAVVLLDRRLQEIAAKETGSGDPESQGSPGTD